MKGRIIYHKQKLYTRIIGLIVSKALKQFKNLLKDVTKRSVQVKFISKDWRNFYLIPHSVIKQQKVAVFVLCVYVVSW